MRNFIVKQGVKSKNSERDCLYRGKNGVCCAFGCVITDEDYCERMENKTAFALLAPDSEYFDRLAWLNPYKDLLGELQIAHDVSGKDFVNDWLTECARIALRFELNNE